MIFLCDGHRSDFHLLLFICCLLFYIPIEDISIIWRCNHCRLIFIFRPKIWYLLVYGIRTGGDLRYSATPAVTRVLGFCGLIRRTIANGGGVGGYSNLNEMAFKVKFSFGYSVASPWLSNTITGVAYMYFSLCKFIMYLSLKLWSLQRKSTISTLVSFCSGMQICDRHTRINPQKVRILISI